jgi:hypothetical protein
MQTFVFGTTNIYTFGPEEKRNTVMARKAYFFESMLIFQNGLSITSSVDIHCSSACPQLAMTCLSAGSELITTQQESKDSTEMRRLFWAVLKKCKQQDNHQQLLMAGSVIRLLYSTKNAASLTDALPQSFVRMVVHASPLLVFPN